MTIWELKNGEFLKTRLEPGNEFDKYGKKLNLDYGQGAQIPCCNYFILLEMIIQLIN